MLGLTNYQEEPSRVWQGDWELPLEESGHVVLQAGLPSQQVLIYAPAADGRYVSAGAWVIQRAAVFRPRHGVIRRMLESRGLPEDEIEARWGDVWVALRFSYAHRYTGR